MKTYFLIYSLVVASAIILGVFRYLPKQRGKSISGLIIWFLYGGILSYSGIFSDPEKKPLFFFLLIVPFIVWTIVIIKTALGREIALSVPIKLLIGFQVYRVGIELFLENLWQIGLVPNMMTYHGANFDILIGLSAPIIAFLLERNFISKKVALIWNCLGLVVLANVVARGFLTTPGFLNILSDDYPNTALTTFPFTYIAVLMVPVAASLHIFSIRNLRSKAV